MKHLLSISALMLVLCASCVNTIEMSTEVHEDGTCTRELWFKVDSASLVNADSLAPQFFNEDIRGEQWAKTIGYKGEEPLSAYPMRPSLYDSLQAQINVGADKRHLLKDTLCIHARRDFSSVGQMAENLPFTVAGQPLHSTATLERRFLWFYTDYIYTETFPTLNTLFEIPITDYMDETSASYWLTGSPQPGKYMSGMQMKDSLDKLEKNFWRWYGANRFNDFIHVVANNYDSIDNAPMTREEFLATKDSFILKMVENQFSSDDDTSEELTEQKTNEFFHSDAYTKAMHRHPALKAQVDELAKRYEEVYTFSVYYRLSLPGGIIQANECSDNIFLQDGTMHAELSGLRLLVPHYTITATSSAKNGWAFLLTWAVVILAVGLCLWPLFRKRNNQE